MSDIRHIKAPLDETMVLSLKAGENVRITGTIFTARDAAHKKLIELIDNNKPLPFDINGQILYYVGPAPAPPGKPIGSAGPTTSYRMDPYTIPLLKLGLKGMIGKGDRAPEILNACKEHHAVYFVATGGAAALIARTIKKAEVIAFDELGPEAIRKLEVEDFPAIVVYDANGIDFTTTGRRI